MTDDGSGPGGFDYRYSIIPGRAPTDRRLNGCDMRLLALLGRHTKRHGWCIRSQVVIAQELGVGRATVGRAMDRLIKFGYIERKANGRGRAQPDPHKQPFSAFSYRVKIDADEDAASYGRVPTNEHPAKPKTGSGQGVPTIDGQGVPSQSGHPLEGSSQGSIPTNARALFDERWDAIWAAFVTWPVDQAGWSERRARVVCERIVGELPAPEVLIACIRAEGAAIAAANGERGADRKRIAYPHNWLDRDRGWQRHLGQVEQTPRRVAESVAKVSAVGAALGDDAMAILRKAGVTDVELTSWFSDATVEVGDRVRIVVGKGFHRNWIAERFASRIERAAGKPVDVILRTGQRSAA